MTIDRRSLIAATGAAAAGALVAPSAARAHQSAVDGSKSASLFLTEDDGLAPATFDRLPLEWHKGRVKALQARLQEQGYAGALLSDRWNLIYFTGLFHSTTERPFAVFLPADKLAAIWFHPSLDRDLVKSWWSTDSESYFDFHHAEGAFPNLGKVQQGEKANLFEWVLKGLKKRGYDGKRIATDRDLSRRQRDSVAKVFVKTTEFDSIADQCEQMRDDQDARGARALASRLPRLRRDARVRARPAARKGHGPDGLRARPRRGGVRHEPDPAGDQARRRAAHGRRHRLSASASGSGRAPAIRTRTSSTTTRSRRARRSRSRAASGSAAAAASCIARS